MTHDHRDHALRILLLVASLGVATRPARSSVAGEGGAPDGRIARVRELVEVHCIDCHGEFVAEAGLRLDRPGPDLTDETAFRTWARVHDRVRDGEMPPEVMGPLHEGERRALLDSLAGLLGEADRRRQREQGRAALRRLNRVEYENTLRDLLALPRLDVRETLPPDGIAHGFDKSAEALDFSHVLVASYLDAADYALDKAMANRRITPKRRVVRAEINGIEGVERSLQTFKVQLKQGIGAPLIGTEADPTLEVSRGDFAERDPGYVRDPEPHFDGVATFINHPLNHNITIKPFKIEVPGYYTIRVRGFALRNDHGVILPTDRPAAVAFYADEGRLLGRCDLPPGGPATAEVRVWIEPGEQVGFLAVSNRNKNFRFRPDGEFRWHDFEAEGVGVQWFEMAGPLDPSWPPESHRRLFGDLPLEPKDGRRGGRDYEVTSNRPEEDARRLLGAFIRLAYRRPTAEADLSVPMAAFAAKLDKGDGFEAAMLAAYRAVLCSPDCLLLDARPGPLGPHELASRISYFLWCSPPDEELRAAADDGSIADPEVLRRQVDRMLNDPKAERFAAHFTDYWLDLRNLRLTEPDETLYPEYSQYLLESMVEETRAFFLGMVRADLPARSVIDSDFAMLNQELAEHYGVPGVEGSAIRRVQLPPESVRGGLLTQASVLKVTANGTTTSPVTRGVFVLDRLLGDPPPPPPPAVPAVEPDISGATTIRELLSAHRADRACASCHAKIDPPGFALEGFDVMGTWRDRYRSLGQGQAVGLEINGKPVEYRLGPPVDDSGALPDGRTFDDVEGFRRFLLEDDRPAARNLLERLVAYATGAGVGFADREVVEAILDRTGPGGFGIRSMIHEVVRSRLFLEK